MLFGIFSLTSITKKIVTVCCRRYKRVTHRRRTRKSWRCMRWPEGEGGGSFADDGNSILGMETIYTENNPVVGWQRRSDDVKRISIRIRHAEKGGPLGEPARRGSQRSLEKFQARAIKQTTENSPSHYFSNWEMLVDEKTVEATVPRPLPRPCPPMMTWESLCVIRLLLLPRCTEVSSREYFRSFSLFRFRRRVLVGRRWTTMERDTPGSCWESSIPCEIILTSLNKFN